MGGEITRALVLSGGGGRGAYECGVYKYLEEAGLEPTVLVGTSIGAVNAAAIASGLSAAELERMWLSMLTRHVHRFWRIRPWRGLYDTSPWAKTLVRHIDFNALNTTDRWLLITATDLEAGRLRIFDNREMEIRVEHILASCSIPVVYPWTEVGGARYWDGAVMANTPLAPAIDAGADEIYVVLLSPIGARRMELPRRPWHAIALAFELALLATFENDRKQLETVNQLVRAQLDTRHREVRCEVIAPSEPVGLDLILKYDPKQIRRLIDLGYEDARGRLSLRSKDVTPGG